VTVFDPSITIAADRWYKCRIKIIGPYLQYFLLDDQHDVLLSELVEIPVLDNIYRCQLLTSSAQAECFLDNARLRPYTGGELIWFGFTETFTHPYTLVIEGATLDGAPLEIGDEIGVYDGDLCVGAEAVNGEYPLEINAWRATASDPGYAPGHAISFRIWSAAHGDFAATLQHQAGGIAFADGIFSRVSLSAVTQAADEPLLQPGKFALRGAYPNPFNSTVRIDFELPQSAQTTLRIYNMVGQQVATLLDRSLVRGTHSVVFHGDELSSGLYFARLESAGRVANTKLLLLK
jgi:hypothetical protein